MDGYLCRASLEALHEYPKITLQYPSKRGLLQVSTSNLLRSVQHVHVKLRNFFTRYFDRLKNCENVQSCLGLFMPHLCREIFIALTVIKIALFD